MAGKHQTPEPQTAAEKWAEAKRNTDSAKASMSKVARGEKPATGKHAK